MSDGPYDFSRERWEARTEAERKGISARRVGGDVFDAAEVPDKDEL